MLSFDKDIDDLQDKIPALPESSERKGTSLCNPKGLDLQTMQLLYMSGLNYHEIARKMGCDHSNVMRRLQPYIAVMQTVPGFNDSIPNVLKLKALLFLANITKDSVKDVSAAQSALPAAILLDKANKADLQVNINVDVHSEHVNNIRDLDSEIQKLQSAKIMDVDTVELDSQVDMSANVQDEELSAKEIRQLRKEVEADLKQDDRP